MAIVTTVVTGMTLLVSVALLCFYKFHSLEKVKQEDAAVQDHSIESKPGINSIMADQKDIENKSNKWVP